MKKTVIQSTLMFIRLFFSYIIMLIIMTYNVGLFIAVGGGFAVSYAIFGFKPLPAAEEEEEKKDCHTCPKKDRTVNDDTTNVNNSVNDRLLDKNTQQMF
mmetsp:Transcript_55680/g.76620  ORF Transcript_55680/g.76620 Transcript_55680/m.76620 type:complete len:99 (+) Transcript_55680:301-597(+)